MLFHSITFLVFIIILYLLLFFVKENRKQKPILLIASYIFYMWWNPYLILLVLFSTCIDYYVGIKIEGSLIRSEKKKWLWVSIVGNLSLLFFFKYFNFFQENVFFFLQVFGIESGWSTLHIILPLGISFYTFQSMSYTIDIYRGKLKPIGAFLDFSLYISFFPQMIAGPIIRAVEFLPQLLKERSLNFSRSILLLFAKGLFKKVVIADNLSYFTGGLFQHPELYSAGMFLVGSIFCYIQLYCDFSGYSDMAIALGRSMGFSFPDNFNKPMHARSLTDFWKRWHITLSTWFRDYVYIPLGGSKKNHLINLMITMFVFGIWHGAGWNFILLGFLHGFLLVVEKKLELDKKGGVVYRVVSQILFMVLLIVFWSSREGVLFTVWDKFTNFSMSMTGIGYLNVHLVVLVSIIFVFFQFVYKNVEQKMAKVGERVFFMFWIVYGFLFYSLMPTYEEPFIYFQF